jgi:hypothetical protein
MVASEEAGAMHPTIAGGIGDARWRDCRREGICDAGSGRTEVSHLHQSLAVPPGHELDASLKRGSSMVIIGRTKHTEHKFVHEAHEAHSPKHCASRASVWPAILSVFRCASRVCFGVLHGSLCFAVLRKQCFVLRFRSAEAHCASVCFVL